MNIKEILFICAFGYSVFFLERFLSIEKKAVIKTNKLIDIQNNKIHDYEKRLLQNTIHVNTLSNSKLDSLWTAYTNGSNN